MNAWTAPALAAAGLLIPAGAAKLVRPGPTARALTSVGLPAGQHLVRAVAMAEAGIGLATVLMANRVLLALTAASYVAFSAFVVLALRRGGVVSSCGCAGRDDTPPTATHLVVTVGLSAAASAAAVGGAAGLLGTPGSVALRLTVAGFAAFIGWLGWLAISVLPRLRSVG